ncbi:MAG: flavodoxin-dependent (E)-4-hydroxy-3-methylbut-2-enyl-diphosphate synthase [Candidatus Calescibacterium sp.]|nr:flavodoxin-dependent (E)-4-hydroxy-3-methylbut-2-enyl-diphosphate synthase [Candidatus Calescibacterium sp.]MCX7971680.1 flavodoxin-dependent (E)-4-hydroxy-3-methylbut-2-enyl-diphosphate synthase [bacterium]MDW8195286.1 flavodoxin-dependent (E)-4-hydroxy-3-methylbut-2-enyl-diphosphate synthase [Candidatus Calescibacterium sp.]
MVRKRRISKVVRIGNVPIGGGNPIVVQSMVKCPTTDVKEVLNQLNLAKSVGAKVMRVAVPDKDAAIALGEIVKNSPLPLVADIHFDYRLALMAIDAGIHALRINPGNILDSPQGNISRYEKLESVVKAAKSRNIPIRIGVNSGSLHPKYLEKYGYPTYEALVESAIDEVRILENMGFEDIKISVKSSNVEDMISAYMLLAEKVPYALHLGVTEAGSGLSGYVKSSIGIGTLLYHGIGDTIRVSLTSSVEEEIRVGYEILKALGYEKRGVELISCPTCGRIEVNLFDLVEKVKKEVEGVEENITVAIMGCVVNGPGEARKADIAVVGGKGKGIIYRKGKMIKVAPENQLIDAFKEVLNQVIDEKRNMELGGVESELSSSV